jgi:hypothetical protein
MYITLFFPISILIAGALGRAVRALWCGLRARSEAMMPRFGMGPAAERATVMISRGAGPALFGAAVTMSLLFGVRQQVAIVNEQTILAFPQDRPALEWMAANLQEDARVAVSSWRWLGNTWSASDGGAWLLPLTGHDSTTPPADYAYSAELAQSVEGFNEAAAAIEDWSKPEVPAWLRKQGITHLYIGAKGGFLDPAEMARNPGVEMVYERNGTFVFAVR